MITFEQFCERYKLDPDDPDSMAEYGEAWRQLARLEAACATGVLYREEEGTSRAV